MAMPALPHPLGMQPQATPTPARSAPEKAVQAMGADMPEADGLSDDSRNQNK